jgi:hypothetical protein
MKPPRRKMTIRALIIATAAFALDFAGMAWVIRPEHRYDPFVGLIGPIVLFGPILILGELIYLYVPRRLDEVLMVILILIVLVLLMLPALYHS